MDLPHAQIKEQVDKLNVRTFQRGVRRWNLVTADHVGNHVQESIRPRTKAREVAHSGHHHRPNSTAEKATPNPSEPNKMDRAPCHQDPTQTKKQRRGLQQGERERERKRVFRPAELLARRGKQGAKECSAQPAGLFQGMLQQAGVDATFHQIQRLGQGFSLKNEEHRENKKVMIVAQ